MIILRRKYFVMVFCCGLCRYQTYALTISYVSALLLLISGGIRFPQPLIVLWTFHVMLLCFGAHKSKSLLFQLFLIRSLL